MKQYLPKITIITPSFNRGKYIEDAIISVLQQNYDNFEHVIIDGGSTDGTLDILKAHPHLIWVSEADKGQSDAMNKGFRMSSGDIVVYLNADDYFEEGAFLTVADYFRANKDAKFIVGKLRVIEESGVSWINDPKISFSEMLRWWEPDAYSYNPAAYFYKREVHEQGCMFNENEHYFMDWEFLLTASRFCQFSKMDSVLGTFRLIKGTKTSETKPLDYYNRRLKSAMYFAEVLPLAERLAFVDEASQIYKEQIKRVGIKNS